MEIGLALPQLGLDATPEVIGRYARRAEELGFASLWVHERMFNPLGEDARLDGPERDLAPFELLSFAAALTSRIRLGTSVITLGYHRPIMLAKQSATLDVLSNGRVLLGIGLGLNKEEYRQNEVDYHKRGKRSAEFIRALKACWMPDPVEFRGEFFDIPPSNTSPKPVQRNTQGDPQIPLIGGFRSQPGQKRTAELCDAWQTAGPTLEDSVEQYAQANEWATKEFGRPPLPFYWRVWVTPAFTGRKPPPQVGDRVVPHWYGESADIIPHVQEAARAGIDHLIIDTNRFRADRMGADYWLDQLEFFAPLLDAIAPSAGKSRQASP